jgi:surfactin synthase thioesterase subunit
MSGKQQNMQLIALPFAGGNETSYERFRPYLPEGWELVSFALPGKGSRIHEPLLSDIHAIVSVLAEQMEQHTQRPYALYGHSMGAMLAHLLIHRTAAAGRPLPKHLFVSSFPAPSHHHDRHRGQMTDTQFIDHMKRLGGLPPAVLEEPKLLSLILPMLRADIAAIDGYRYIAEEPHSVSITAMFGSQEQALVASIRDWQAETTQPIRIQRFDGDHFFIYPHAEAVVRLITGTPM